MIGNSSACKGHHKTTYQSAGYNSGGYSVAGDGFGDTGSFVSKVLFDGFRRMFDSFQDQRYLRSKIKLLQSEVSTLKRENISLSNGMRDKIRTLESELVRITADRNNLRQQLIAQSGTGTGGHTRPSPQFVSRPLVVKSSRGEYLGLSNPGAGHFSLTDFTQILKQGMADVRHVDVKWMWVSPNWTLQVATRDKKTGYLQNMVLVVTRDVTPSNNVVTSIVRMNIGGNDVPNVLILNLFKRIREHYQ